ncbi:ATP synthase subunit I [Nitrosomonas sp.]|uniref:ATP synthase subunit I n=1 Tax=Nitrosomonas sp. TaxID=42353 RepID=UPI0025DF4E1A|nr:ATP synthase subunit I [Nitrosomonas sp.]
MATFIKNRPLGIILLWQMLFSIVASVVCGLLSGISGALSGFLGVLVSVIAGGAYAVMVSRHSGYSAGGVLRTALRAEAVKIFLVVMLLWIVFTAYKDLNPVMFIGSFIIAVMISSMAIFVAEKPRVK